MATTSTGLFASPKIYRVTGTWLTHGAWQKSKQNKARKKKREQSQKGLLKPLSFKDLIRKEGALEDD